MSPPACWHISCRPWRRTGDKLLFLTIWPIFALICTGFLLMRRGFPASGFWPSAERLTYFILFPALLTSSLADAPLREPAMMQLGIAAVVTILIAAAGLWVVRRMMGIPAVRFGPMLQSAVRFNTYLGLSILATLAGPLGIERAAVYLAIAVPLVNVLSILALTASGPARAPRALIRNVLRNPLILACIIGFVLALSGIGLPFGSDRFLALLGQASLPLGLLCVGAALRPATMRLDMPALVVTSALRLLAMPVLALLIAWAFGLDEAGTLTLVVFSAVPTAPTAYVLTRQLGGDGDLMAGMVTSQTLAAALTIPLVLMLSVPG